MPFDWKDELLLRQAACAPSREQAEDGPRDSWRATRDLNDAILDRFIRDCCDLPMPVVSMEYFLQERTARETAEQRVQDFRKASETWCTRSGEYCRQRNGAIWAVAITLGWAIGATWMLIARG